MKNKLTRILCAVCVALTTTAAAQWNVSAAPGGIPIHTNVSGAQEQTVLCATAVRDGIIYAWRDTRTGTNGQDIWCQKYTPCGAIAPGWPAAGLSICNAANGQQLPQIVPDATDGAIIVWQDNRSGGDLDIYAQHVSGAGVPLWGSATTGMAVCAVSGDQQNVHACTDGSGGVILSWDDQRSGNWDIWTQRVNSAGTILWNPAGGGNPVAVFAGSTQDQNAICSDNAGGAYYAWEDNRPIANGIDIYATRFDGNGNPVGVWNGPVVLSNISANQITPCIAVYPGTSDVIFAWCDPTGTGQSIQASKMYGATAGYYAGWNANGNLVGYAITSSGNPGTASQPRIVTDCSGGAIISFRSPYGGGDNDVLTRRMNANGTQGTFEYTAFSTNWEGNHELASDGNGGAWNVFENRNGPTVVQYRKFTFGTVTASSGANARDIPNICAMGGVAYFVWEDARPGTLGAHDLYAGSTSSLAPPPILNSNVTTVYTATTCGITTQSVTVCSGTSLTFTVPLPGGLFNNYTFLDGATTLQNSSSNTYTTSALTAGTHTITVTSNTAAGCTTAVSNAIVVTISAGPNLALNTQTNVLCNGGATGAATMTASGGTGPYTYAWAPSGGTAATATGLTAGTYTCTVTDANGCTRNQTVTITQPNAIAGSATSTPATCGNNNGTATASPTGGTGSYTYLWSPSGGTAATATGLIAGNYTCTVTDANGCTGVLTTPVNNSGAPTVSIQSQTNVLCFGGLTGAATVSVSGGQSPYTYSWSPSGGISATATGLGAGSYTVTVTDANTCVQTQVITITQPTQLLATSGGTNPLCNGGATGSATVTPSGGAGSYTYAWLPSGGTSATATGLTANNYTCTITDANGCTVQQTVVLTAPAAITSTPAQTNVSCNGGSNGTASVTAGGGTPGYTYLWAPSGGTGSSATNLSASSYTCTITDANGCTLNQTFTLTAPSAISATMSQTNVLCNGDSTASAAVVASGGTPAYAYSWSPYGGTAATATGLASGTYTCTISDANGCQNTATVSITQNTAITSVITFTNALCNGAASGSANAAPSGGTPGYTYNWSSGATTATAGSLAAGTYTVTVTDNNGCSHQNTAVISEPTAITSTSGSTDATCNTANGSATVTPTGGTGSYTYLWSPSGGTAATASGLSAGVFTCLVTDVNGCTHTATVAVNNAGAPTVTLNTSTDVTCNGGNDGAASVNVAGGTSPYTYAWTPSGGTASSASGLNAGAYLCTVTDAIGCIQSLAVTINEPAPITTAPVITDATCGSSNGQVTLNASGGNGTFTYNWSSGGTTDTEINLGAGNYTCIVTDVAGCVDTFSITINNAGSPNVTLGSQTDVSCAGGSNGSITVTVTGGTGPYVYAWAPSAGTAATESNLTAGTYTCIVTDNNGCTQSFSSTVTEPTALLASDTTTPDMCNSQVGTATVNVSGGTAPYSYTWSSGGTASTETSLSAGVYSCQIIDANGCSIIDSVTVLGSGGPAVQLQTSTDPTCYNGSDGTATVSITSGNGPYTYAWSPSGGTNATGTGLDASQVYTCTITDVNGCTSTQTVQLSQPPVYTASVTASTPVSCFGGIDGTATVTGSGGTGPYTYSWNPTMQTSATATNLLAGGYVVIVTDANGCTTQASVTITQPSSAVTVSVTPTSGCGTASASASASGGSGSYTYLWSPAGGTTSTATGLSTGSYTLITTDANGCADTSTTSVVANPNPTATVTATSSVVPIGGNTTLTAAGGTSYSWTPSAGLSCTNCASPLATPTVNTTYCAMVTDVNGCQDSACIAITVDTDCGEVFVPNAFSPNNDGSNDLLLIYGAACITEMEFVIFDRWGEQVYSSTNPSASWDGMYNGKELNAGVFVYYLRGTMYNGNPLSLEGNISLVR